MGKEHDIPLGISVGAALTPEHSRDYNTLFQYADSSLYRVKQNGKHGYNIFSPSVETDTDGENLEQEIIRITRIVEERGEVKGALMLGQEAFSQVYRFIIRFLKRYGGSANSILFSLSLNKEGGSLLEASTEFGALIEKNVRNSDLVFQSKSNQFFILFPLLSEQNVSGVVDRIMEKWKETDYFDTVSVGYAAKTVSF